MISDKQKAMKADRLGNGLGDGNGLSWTFGYCLVVGKQKLVIDKYDRLIIREHANRVAQIAARSEQMVKKSYG